MRTRKSYSIAAAIVAAAAVTAVGSTAPADAVAPPDHAMVTLNDGASVAILDTSSGTTSALVGSNHNGLYGDAFSTDGNLYGIENGQLVLLDPVTGAATAAIGSNQGLRYGLDQAPDGTMYAESYTSAGGTGLYTVDTTTGGVTFVGANSGAMDVTFDCSGTLWGTDNGQLFAYDLATGAVDKTVTLTGVSSAGAVMGLFVDAAGDMLATTYSSNGQLFKVDPDTGAMTLIGDVGSYPHGGDDVNACSGLAKPTTIASVSGSATFGQSATLTATLTAAGTPVAGEDLTFSLDGTAAGTATTDAAGVATLPGVDLAGLDAGTYTGDVSVGFAGDGTYVSSSGTGDLTVAKAAQTVTFDSTDPGAVVGGPAYTPSASGGGSGNPVTFSVDAATTNGACTASAGTVTYAHNGTCVLDADQAGGTNYEAAPSAQQQITVGSAAQAVTFTSTAPAAVVGGSYAAAATGGASGQPVVFSSDATTTNDACTVASDGTVTFDHAGSCVIDADQAATDDYTAAPTAQQTVAVAAAATATELTVGPNALTATVTAVDPAAGTPTGNVSFSVNGSVVGTSPLVGGTATLAYTVPSGGERHVAAIYLGGTDFTGSASSTTRSDPTITARVTSARPKSSHGWYSGPVTVRFTCTPGSGQLTAPCPAPVTLVRSRAGQSVTRAITTTDGGAAVANVAGVNIDRSSPSVQVTGVRNGAVYRGTHPRPLCAGHDAVSGVVHCGVRLTHADGVTRYVATATNGAGLSTTTRGSFRTLTMWLAGKPWHGGHFDVRPGSRVMVVIASRVRPRYEWAAPAVPGAAPPHGGDVAFNPNGVGQWQLPVTLDAAMARRYSQWNLGAYVGKRLEQIRIVFPG